jgi:hypothetical protein
LSQLTYRFDLGATISKWELLVAQPTYDLTLGSLCCRRPASPSAIAQRFFFGFFHGAKLVKRNAWSIPWAPNPLAVPVAVEHEVNDAIILLFQPLNYGL